MPAISIFYGIIIRMFFAPSEHNPPHFHIFYNEFEATIDLRNFEIIEGNLPIKQKRIVVAWAELHSDELMLNWDMVMRGEEPKKINPLQ
jgi:hypothetical protein